MAAGCVGHPRQPIFQRRRVIFAPITLSSTLWHRQSTPESCRHPHLGILHRSTMTKAALRVLAHATRWKKWLHRIVVRRRAKCDWNRSELGWCTTFQARMNHVIVVAVSTEHLPATFPCARRANRGSAMGALCYCGPTAPPLRISRTVFDCAEQCHTRLDSCLWNPVCRALHAQEK
jgi:hypothetical protein